MLDVCKESKVLLDLFRELRNAAEALVAGFSASCCVEKPPSFQEQLPGPRLRHFRGSGAKTECSTGESATGLCRGGTDTRPDSAR